MNTSQIMEYIQRLLQNMSLRMKWAGALIFLLLYYLLIVTPFDSAIQNAHDTLDDKRKAILWMVKEEPEFMRLHQEGPHQAIKPNESVFTVISQSVNTNGWQSIVTDVHQIDQNKVQVNFNSIEFKKLLGWIQQLSQQSGIYIQQASLKKLEPGVVQATLVFQSKLSS